MKREILSVKLEDGGVKKSDEDNKYKLDKS